MEHYASGNWSVSEGKEDEFIAGWREWLEWSRDNAPGLIFARLVRDDRNPRHFLSWSQWEDPTLRAAWWQKPGFDERLSALRALCDDFQGGNYELPSRSMGDRERRRRDPAPMGMSGSLRPGREA